MNAADLRCTGYRFPPEIISRAVWLVAVVGVPAAVLARAGDVPLIDAVKRVDTDTVRALLEQSVDVNAAAVDGATALHGVGFRGINSVAEYLVEQGAKLDARDQHGWIPWSIANGFSYSDFYKAQKHTAALLAKQMAERGMSTESEAIPGSVCFDCLQTRRDQLEALSERD